MQWLFDALASLLAVFYSVVPNYGITIILLTLAVMMVVTPLTMKGTRSMMMMQQLQPEIKKLQAKYKDDRQKLNEEMMAFYKEHQVNPVGGCLPLLVQAPVFIVLFQVLRGLTRRESDLGYETGWALGGVGTGAGADEAPSVQRTFDPAYLEPDSELYQSLSGVDQMRAFGLDLSESAAQVLGESVVQFLPYLVLIAVVAVTGFLQQKQIQGRVRKDQVNPQQQMIMRILPVMLPIISFTLQGGLVLYFAVSNLFRVGQQWWISRNIYGLKRGETVDGKETGKAGSSEGDDEAADDADGAGATAAVTAGDAKAETKAAKAKATGKKPAAKKKAAPKKEKVGTAGRKRGTAGKGSKRTQAAPQSPIVQPRGRKKKR